MFLRDSVVDFLTAQSYAQNTENLYKHRLLALSKYEDEVHKPIYKFSFSEMHEAFRHTTNNPRVAQALKWQVGVYFDWLNQLGINTDKGRDSLNTLDQEALKYQRSKQFFHGLPQLLSKIEADTTYAARVERRIPSDYRMLSSTFILLWYGLKVPEIIKVKKEDILGEENAFSYNEVRYEVHPRAYEILKECAEAASYTKTIGNNVRIFCYEDSELLIRTAGEKGMSESTLRNLISGLNRTIEGKSQPYKTEKIYWSGIFYRAYQYELNKANGFADIIVPDDKMIFFGELFRENYSTAYQVNRRLQEYKEYTSIFRNRAGL